MCALLSATGLSFDDAVEAEGRAVLPPNCLKGQSNYQPIHKPRAECADSDSAMCYEAIFELRNKVVEDHLLIACRTQNSILFEGSNTGVLIKQLFIGGTF